MAIPLYQQSMEAIGKQYQRNHAEGTNKAVKGTVRGFCNYLKATFGLQKIETLKQFMVLAYVEHRKGEVQESALERDATAIRLIASAIAKENIVPRTNKEMGIVRGKAERCKPVQQDTAKASLIREKLSTRAEESGLAKDKALVAASGLQEAYGLRAKESLMSSAVYRNCKLELQVAGAKGGRPRTLQAETPAQKVVLQNLQAVSREIGNVNGKLIPAGMSLKQMYDYQRNTIRSLGAVKAEKTNMHSSRHQFAQDCKKNGDSNQGIALKLGHGREEVIDHYQP